MGFLTEGLDRLLKEDLPESAGIKPGDKIRIIHLQGEDSRYDGKTGEVTHIDDIGDIWGTWGGLAIIPGVDEYEIISDIDIEEAFNDSNCTFRVRFNNNSEMKDFTSEDEAIKYAKSKLKDEPHVWKACGNNKPVEIASYQDWNYGIKESINDEVKYTTWDTEGQLKDILQIVVDNYGYDTIQNLVKDFGYTDLSIYDIE